MGGKIDPAEPKGRRHGSDRKGVIAAFIVPFMLFYNSALLMDGGWLEVIRAGGTAVVGVLLLRSAVQGWFMGGRSARFIRLGVLVAALFVIEGGEITDVVGVGLAGRCS